ncbi:retron Ec67 family RNA-directed DNA polymerase/endonuclease [Hydrogenophaga sp. NFH-34]|uniref:retron Ec67 family RNA-directed DNA polymerase/endonuclease n=1 Tax=Hydrogenophaga sp. NFH-34 TaxID=2744446 RepID=UPI001F369BAC|nr:retron Ec67 family RNA-directed DNA polymerase/endonuclease [Hydrogenophaga sp. NFH-34]
MSSWGSTYKMRKIEALKSVKSINGLADLLGFKASALGYILFKLPDAQKYNSFTIPKRSGGRRSISAPVPRLMLLQKKISTLLNDCLAEIEGKLSSPAHGFKLGRSIFTNAAHHRGRRYVLNLDLKDFFPSIHFGRIAGYFEKSRDFGLDPKIARILANVLCHKSSLPQGSPSSPVVSNLLARMLDIHLAKLAKRNRLTYTRYADDLTFSTNLNVFPEAVAKRVSEHVWQLGPELISTIGSCGFSINDLKTRMLYRSSRQEVTGLVVNDKVSVPVEYRRWARAAVARLVKTGAYFKPTPKGFIGPQPATPDAGSLDHLEGCLSHIYNAHRFQRSQAALGRALHHAPDELNSDEHVYRRFLFYTKFYVPEKPVIVCEGETDSIYIAAAISAMGGYYPDLIDAKLKPGEQNRFNVRFFKHSSIAGRLLELNGGTDALKNFCRIYVDQTKKFKGGLLSQPTIVIVDNDKAGRDVVNYAKGIAKNQGLPAIKGLNYVFTRPNLYVVSIQSPANAPDCVIEDLFPAHLLNTKLGGKVLTLSNQKVGDNEYGKMYFAKHVVPHADPKDFSGFSQLLDTLVEVIADFSSRVQVQPATKKA